jgi:DNA-binding beta-propeller fold protein YncE
MPLAARVFPDGNNAVVLGTDVSQNPSQGVHVYVLELASGSVRRLVTGIQDDLITNVAVARDGQSILASVRSGNLVRVVTIPMNGSGGTSTTLTLMGEGHSELDAGPDGSIYSAAINKSFAIVRFPFRGGHAEQIAALPDVSRMADGVGAAALPDGRIVVASAVKGHPRLMVLETGKTPRALIPTREDTAGPVTAVGARDLAFLIGPEPRHTIAVAEIASGRITRRLPFDKGRIRSLAASPDGRTLYVSAGGVIWSTTASGGGEPRKIRAGDSAAMDPSGRRLVVQVNDTPKVRLFEVEVNGGTEREIALSGPFQLTDFPLFSGAITADGQLMVPLASANSWFFWPGLVNLATGTMTRIPVDRVGDYWMQLQAHDGQVIAGAFEDRAVLWRFQPETVSSPKPR